MDRYDDWLLRCAEDAERESREAYEAAHPPWEEEPPKEYPPFPPQIRMFPDGMMADDDEFPF